MQFQDYHDHHLHAAGEDFFFSMFKKVQRVINNKKYYVLEKPQL
jgi:hypothetical protein